MKRQIAFILKLRVVSALLVMVYHYCHFFWMNQSFCGKLANYLPVTDVPWIANFLESLPINLGNLGVAVFFLISGFLMPIVAQNKTRIDDDSGMSWFKKQSAVFFFALEFLSYCSIFIFGAGYRRISIY